MNFKKSDFEEDKKLLINFYQKNGFRDFGIISDSVKLSDDKKWMDLTLNVFEGPQYKVRNIEWEGNTVYPDNILTERLGFTKGGTTYHIFGGYGIQVVYDGSDSNEVSISFYQWQNSTLRQSYRIPIVAKELFKLYFGKDADRVWNYFNKNDIPERFTANGRTVKAQYVEATGSIYLQVGHKK